MCPAPRHTFEQQAKMIHDASVKVIENSSLLDFKMTAIAKEAGLSVGSLYKYVQTKEDVIIALACEMNNHFHSIMSTIFSSSLSMPQKLIAITMLSPKKAQKYSFALDLEIISSSEPVLRRCSPMWKARLLAIEDKMSAMCQQKNLDCFNSGEFLGESVEEVYELSFGNWAMTAGFKQIHSHFEVMSEHMPFSSSCSNFDFSESSIKSMTRYINAYPWKAPLTPEGIEEAKQTLIQMGYR